MQAMQASKGCIWFCYNFASGK